MEWTKQQKDAIYTRGNNIIVSAGAGSGKTAVLSERILDYCQKGNDIRRVLVLTFTNAAAAEMKERIRKKLIDNNLLAQAELIDVADITTFDSYSLSLVKKYYYRLGVDKNIGIMDNALLAVKRKEILDGILLKKYESNDAQFLSFLSKYTNQDDSSIKNKIINLSQKIELLVDTDDFFDNYIVKYYSECKIEQSIKDYINLAMRDVKEFSQALNKLIDIASTDLESVKLYDKLVIYKNNLENFTNFEDVGMFLRTTTLPSLSRKADPLVSVKKGEVGKMREELLKSYFNNYCFISTMREELYAVKDDILFLLSIVRQLNEELFNYKKSIMCFDFIDIAKMAISLVRDFEDVHDEIALGLDEILVDEYQDTSDIQETFISYINRNNCYMVGDIKQSIYRFRNANPYIFKEKYDKYSKNNDGIKIDLTFNYRSRKEVLSNINNIFNHLMTNGCGDANYMLEHQMIYGLKAYDQLIQKYDFNMEILSYEEVLGFDDCIVEAFICAQKIKEIMNSNVQVLKKDGYEPVSYSDFAILIDQNKFFPLFKRVFEYNGIPLAIEADMDLNDSVLPRLFGNVLTILDSINRNSFDSSYKHAIASVFRSFLMEYSDEKLYHLVKSNEDDMLDALKVLAQKALMISYEDLFIEICSLFNIYEKLPLIGDVEASLVILNYINNLFVSISNAGMSLNEAASFLKEVFDTAKLKYKLNSSNANSVRVMTIHRSKGLEFPFCLFPMLGTNFNIQDQKQTVGFSRKYGVYIPFVDEGNSNTILRTLVKEEINRADISEKVRLLYVALTRAREKIIIISKDTEFSSKALTKDGFVSFNSMIKSLPFLNEYLYKVDIDTLNLTNNLKKINTSSIKSGMKIEYSENSYLGDVLEKKHISKEMKELISPSLETAINLGLEFHECLEVLDFNNVDVDSLKTSVFVKKTIKKLLEHEIFSNIKNASTYHEHEFYFEEAEESYHGIIDLLVVYDDHIDIIDYKLSNTDSLEYIRQLSIYKKYVNSITDKKVNCYLLSILNQDIKMVEV